MSDHTNEIAVDVEALIAAARAARDNAYAPYSGYLVGSAVWANGTIYAGANVENAAYGVTLCAERAAIVRAVVDGARALDAIAVVTLGRPPAAPCGVCRQAMYEFAPDPDAVRIILANETGERVEVTLAELLPRGFGPKSLPPRDK